MPTPAEGPGAKTLKALGSDLTSLDAFAVTTSPTLDGYIAAVSEYVLNQRSMTASVAKRAQIALSSGLARVLRDALHQRCARMAPVAAEITVAGALRTARADVSESHPLDGLRLAIEIKPVNVAVGRAVWNRFGDIRTFAVNIHLKFPFAVVGGVLAIPTFEWKLQKAATAAGADSVGAGDDLPPQLGDEEEFPVLAAAGPQEAMVKVSTVALIERAVARLRRARLREIEADPSHLLEAVAVIVYDPDTGTLVQDLPEAGHGMRWEEFVGRLVEIYELRFES